MLSKRTGRIKGTREGQIKSKLGIFKKSISNKIKYKVLRIRMYGKQNEASTQGFILSERVDNFEKFFRFLGDFFLL
jgi:hypothetical protein